MITSKTRSNNKAGYIIIAALLCLMAFVSLQAYEHFFQTLPGSSSVVKTTVFQPSKKASVNIDSTEKLADYATSSNSNKSAQTDAGNTTAITSPTKMPQSQEGKKSRRITGNWTDENQGIKLLITQIQQIPPGSEYFSNTHKVIVFHVTLINNTTQPFKIPEKPFGLINANNPNFSPFLGVAVFHDEKIKLARPENSSTVIGTIKPAGDKELFIQPGSSIEGDAYSDLIPLDIRKIYFFFNPSGLNPPAEGRYGNLKIKNLILP